MEIRDAGARDWDAIWRFMRRIVAAGETWMPVPRSSRPA